MAAGQAMQLKLPVKLPAPPFAADDLPDWAEITHWSGRLTHMALACAAGVGVALVLHRLVFALWRRWASGGSLLAANRLYHATRWAMVATGVAAASLNDRLLARLWGAVEGFVVPALTGWVLYALVQAGAEWLARRVQAQSEIAGAAAGTAMEARSRRTRIAILSRSIGFVIIFISVALILLGFPGVRHIGATLIASAGLMGLAVGAAAQPALKSLIAGVQIALTEPIRIGDMVVVDGERGRVEDIRLSYVVIRSADERRLIVPTIKFLDSTFQNWTREQGISGAVSLPLRPNVAVGPLRTAFLAALAQRPEWDGRKAELAVGEVQVGYVEIKLVMSCAEPADLGVLLPAMREEMLDWLQVHQSEALCQET